MSLSVDAYARQLKQLLPRGALWKSEPTSWLSKLLLGISEELARIDARGEDLLDEWDPRTASETLEDWERVLNVAPPSAVDADRQVAVTAALVAQGGSTPAYFIAVAASMGFTATIEEIAASTWRMNVDLSSYAGPWSLVTYLARSGTARSGDPIQSWSVTEFEAVLNRIKPAHTRLYFAYV